MSHLFFSLLAFFRKEFVSAVNLLWGDVVARGFAFLSVVYLVRVLDAQAFGELSIVWAFYGYFLVIVQAGLDALGAREVARDPSSASDIASSIRTIRVAIAFVIVVIVTVFYAGNIISGTLGVLLVAQSLVLLVTALSVEFVFQGRHQMMWIAVGRTIQTGLYFALLVVLVRSSADLLYVPASLACATLVTLAILYPRSGVRLRAAVSAPAVRNLLRASLPIAASMLMIQIYTNLGVLVLGAMRDMTDSGYYTAVSRVALLLGTPVSLLAAAFYPTLSRADPEGEITTLWSNTMQATTVVGVFAAGLPFLLAPWILDVLYGEKLLVALNPFRILIANLLLVSLNVGIANPLLARKREWDYLKVVSTGALVNSALNIVLIPTHGMVGAAAAAVAAEAAVFVVGLRMAKRVARVHGTGALGVALVGGTTVLVAFIMAGVFQIPEWIMAMIWVMTYWLGLLFLKSVPGRSFVRKRPTDA